MTSIRSKYKKLALALASVAFALISAEVLLQIAVGLGVMDINAIRSFNPSTDSKEGAGLYYVHPYTSYAMKPGYRRGDRTVNSLGFRGTEVSGEKTPDAYRIVALGGSTTYGVYQDDDETYPYLLEKQLSDVHPTKGVEVINAGLVSATTAESLHRMFTDVLPMNPDMIVVYHGFNDLVPRVFNGFSNDYFHFRRVAPVSASSTSRLYLVRLALKAWTDSENSNLLTHIWKKENLPTDNDQRIANFERTSPTVFETNLEHIIRISKSYGIQVVLATFAIDSETRHWTDAVPEELWDRGIEQHNSVVKRLAKAHDLPLVEFAEFAQGRTEMFNDSIHMTIEGNHRKAECFAQTIRPVVAGIR